MRHSLQSWNAFIDSLPDNIMQTTTKKKLEQGCFITVVNVYKH